MTTEHRSGWCPKSMPQPSETEMRWVKGMVKRGELHPVMNHTKWAELRSERLGAPQWQTPKFRARSVFAPPALLSRPVAINQFTQGRLQSLRLARPQRSQHHLFVDFRLSQQTRHQLSSTGCDPYQRDAPVRGIRDPLHVSLSFHAIQQAGDCRLFAEGLLGQTTDADGPTADQGRKNAPLQNRKPLRLNHGMELGRDHMPSLTQQGRQIVINKSFRFGHERLVKHGGHRIDRHNVKGTNVRF